MHRGCLTTPRPPRGAYLDKIMKLNAKQRRDVIRSINAAIVEFYEDGYTGRLLRISRMIANLNGTAWPE